MYVLHKPFVLWADSGHVLRGPPSIRLSGEAVFGTVTLSPGRSSHIAHELQQGRIELQHCIPQSAGCGATCL
jgi:hypothetical protein